MRPLKTFVDRHPLIFSFLLTALLFGLVAISVAAIPRTTISTVEDLPPELQLPPSDMERALFVAESPENLFRLLASLLAVVLLTSLDWWREAGFCKPSWWRNVRLLVFPLLVGVLPLLGGFRFSGAAFLAAMLLGGIVAAFSEEALYRGIVWRALLPAGLVQTVVVTSLLPVTLRFGGLALEGPWPEALLLTIPAACASFMYAALRWRLASIWPLILLHSVPAFTNNISKPGTVPYLVPLLAMASTLGFVGYGLLFLRRSRQ